MKITAEKTTLSTEEGVEPTIEAAAVADAGGNERITFTVNPGTETDLMVRTDVENFEMDDISIAGVPTGAVVVQDENAENAETADEGSQQTLSFTSAENKHTDHIVFAISAPGVKIPDPVATKVIEEKMKPGKPTSWKHWQSPVTLTGRIKNSATTRSRIIRGGGRKCWTARK